jgi:hypothetical protein
VMKSELYFLPDIERILNKLWNKKYLLS